MNNTEKLLRAFIEASGYYVEEVTETNKIYLAESLGSKGAPLANMLPEHIIKTTDYKVTKKDKIKFKCKKCGTHLGCNAPLDSCLCKSSDNLVRCAVNENI